MLIFHVNVFSYCDSHFIFAIRDHLLQVYPIVEKTRYCFLFFWLLNEFERYTYVRTKCFCPRIVILLSVIKENITKLKPDFINKIKIKKKHLRKLIMNIFKKMFEQPYLRNNFINNRDTNKYFFLFSNKSINGGNHLNLTSLLRRFYWLKKGDLYSSSIFIFSILTI